MLQSFLVRISFLSYFLQLLRTPFNFTLESQILKNFEFEFVNLFVFWILASILSRAYDVVFVGYPFVNAQFAEHLLTLGALSRLHYDLLADPTSEMAVIFV